MTSLERRTRISATPEEQLKFRLWLQVQFTERCKRNGMYSLRAFAKYLKFDPSTISQILNGKRVLSKKRTTLICEKLSASPTELASFGLIAGSPQSPLEFMQVELDRFATISDWYHYAILELTFVKSFRSDPKWIARKLSITSGEASAAIERLLRLGLLEKRDGSLVKTSKHLTNTTSVSTSGAQRELQRQIIQKALQAIDDCQQEEKSITSMTMAIDVNKIEQAKEMIGRFRRELCVFLEDGQPARVYNLAIQLFPVSNLNIEN